MPTPVQPQDRKKSSKKAKKPKLFRKDQYEPTAWGSANGGLEDLTCPSGQVCLVKRPGIQALMEAGVLRDIDSLSAIINEHIKEVEGDSKAGAKSFLEDEEAVVNIVHVVDRVLVHCVVKPEILMTPNDPTSREPHKIYADMVDLEDKLFIFNFAVGGTRDVERFREQLVERMGSVEPGETVEFPAK